MGELEGGGPVAVNRTGGNVLDHVERSETVKAGKHGGELGVVGALFNFEKDDVFDGGGGGGGRHSDVVGGETAAEGCEAGGDCWSVKLKQWANADAEGDHPGCVCRHCENAFRGGKRCCGSG